jgi:glycosyltransferase involved in cell wall biosynthesis
MEAFMQSKSILTIGIPTYNRPQKLLESLEHLSRAAIFSRMPVLVIDDGSEPATVENVAEFTGNPNFVYRKNEFNRGYPRTLFRLFEECETEYLLVTADDDLISVEDIGALEKRLLDERPDFASTIYLLGGKPYRGAKFTRPIAPSEYIDCSGHAPGLVYRVAAFKAMIPQIMSRLEQGKADAACYPQVLFAIATLLEQRKAIWVDVVGAFENGNLPSGLADVDGGKYWDYASRLRQFAAFDDFIASYPTDNKEIREEMLRTHRKNFIHRIMYAWRMTDPASFSDFENQLMKNRVRRSVARYTPAAMKEFLLRLGV